MTDTFEGIIRQESNFVNKQLEIDAQTWLDQGKLRDLLYEDGQLDSAKEWVRQQVVSPEVWEFVEASIRQDAINKNYVVQERFFGTLRHDILHHIGNIVSSAYILLHDEDENLPHESQVEFLTLAQKSASKAAKLIHKMTREFPIVSNIASCGETPVDEKEHA
jgi:hypothetical protein